MRRLKLHAPAALRQAVSTVYDELRASGRFEDMDLSVDEAEHSMEMHLPYLAKVFQGYLNWPFAYVLCLDSILSKVHMRKESTFLILRLRMGVCWRSSLMTQRTFFQYLQISVTGDHGESILLRATPHFSLR
jgi:hypothetical protein